MEAIHSPRVGPRMRTLITIRRSRTMQCSVSNTSLRTIARFCLTTGLFSCHPFSARGSLSSPSISRPSKTKRPSTLRKLLLSLRESQLFSIYWKHLRITLSSRVLSPLCSVSCLRTRSFKNGKDSWNRLNHPSRLCLTTLGLSSGTCTIKCSIWCRVRLTARCCNSLLKWLEPCCIWHPIPKWMPGSRLLCCNPSSRSLFPPPRGRASGRCRSWTLQQDLRS